jgi:iron complex outermembrane receptor protein
MKPHALSRAVWPLLAAVLVPWLPAGHALAAADDDCELDVPPGPMETSLLEIANRCNVVISLRPALVAGRTAPAVRGRFPVRQAFGLALQSSGLQVETTASGTLTVQPGPAAAPAASTAAPAAAAAPPPAASGIAAVLPPVVVTGSAPTTGLRASRAWAATRSSTPLAEQPQAVSVLTAEALELQGGRSVTDAAFFVPGMVVSTLVSGSVEDYGGTGLTLPSLLIRGMPTAVALSGQRMLRDAVAPDNAFLDRIEVPKGPSGMVDGVADWKGRGGLVNLVLKEPGQGPHDTVSQTLSSRDSGTVRLTADTGRPWGDGAAWRLLGYGERSGRTAGGYERNAAAGLLGSSTLRLGSFSGLLTVHAERRREAPPPAAQGGSTPVDGVFVDLPALRLPRVPADPEDRHLFTSGAAHLNLRWSLSPQWGLTVRAMAQSFQSDLRRHQPFTPPMQRYGRSASLGTQWELAGELTDGVIKHRILLGLDASGWRSDTKGVDFLAGDGPIRIDIRESKTALSLQDELSTGPLRLRVAVQRARTPLHDETWRDNRTGAVIQSTGFLPVSGTNWDAGLLYQLHPTLAVYAGTQRSTEASLVLPGQEADGMPIPPSTTRQVQAGLKLTSADRRLSATLEVFRIRQSAFKLFNYGSTLLPGRSSDGLELELTGRPHPRVDLSLGFSHLRTIDQVAQGDQFMDAVASQIPRRSLHLLSSIRLGDVIGQDNRLGIAFHAASSTLVGYPYYPALALGLPGGGQLDLSWNGSFGAWTVKGALANVFDQRLFGPAADSRFIPLQPGRSISLTASYTD